MAASIRPGSAVQDAMEERERAHRKHLDTPNGSRESARHDDPLWLPILMEEVGEVARALNDGEPLGKLRAEVIQVAAMALAYADAIGDAMGAEVHAHKDDPIRLRVDLPSLPSQPLEDAPIGTLAPAIGGGGWVKVDAGWRWNAHRRNSGGGTFPRPGGDWNGTLVRLCWQREDRGVDFSVYTCGPPCITPVNDQGEHQGSHHAAWGDRWDGPSVLVGW